MPKSTPPTEPEPTRRRTPPAEAGTTRIFGSAKPGPRVRFGSVEVTGYAPAAADVERNILESREALARLGEQLVTPGVKLRRPKGVPFYGVDPDRPDVIIRTIDGRTERGVIVDGHFQAVA